MIRPRLWASVLILWLTGLFNIERLYEPFDIASFVYVLNAVLGVLSLAFTPIRWQSTSAAISLSVVALVAVKGWLGYTVAGHALPLTITESLTIAVTMLLARQISLCVRGFEQSIKDVDALHWVNRPLSFQEMQRDFYREVRRARRHRRPLALLAVRPTYKADSPQIDQLITFVQKKIIRNHLDARVADVLTSELQDIDLVAKAKDRFYVLLPEVELDAARILARRVAGRLKGALGAELKAGLASFPDQEVTLTGLLRRAESQMHDVPAGPAGAAFPWDDDLEEDQPCRAVGAKQTSVTSLNGDPSEEELSRK